MEKTKDGKKPSEAQRLIALAMTTAITIGIVGSCFSSKFPNTFFYVVIITFYIWLVNRIFQEGIDALKSFYEKPSLPQPDKEE